ITTHVVNMPLKLDGDVPHVGGQARTALEMLLVRVDTDEGITGWGEGFGHRIWSATRAAIDKNHRACVCWTRSNTDLPAHERAHTLVA
ncbi:MAG: mandelate racemase/muconate lactonizing enzyme family protein, partial [Betaproteobacteria bacterium]|nr:mandelate racemase/muconate lactonizing enzyme family protein [Betaproteobacteria bacterium]